MAQQLAFRSASEARLFFEQGGLSFSFGDDEYRGAYPGAVSEKRMDDLFEAGKAGFWESEAGYHLTLQDGTAYFASEKDSLPDERPAKEDSLASDEQVTGMLKQLESLDGAFSFYIERNKYLGKALQSIGDEDSDRVEIAGISYGLRGKTPTVLLAYDFGDAEKANENLKFVKDALADVTEREEEVREVKVSGSMVIAEVELDSEEEFDNAYRLLYFGF